MTVKRTKLPFFSHGCHVTASASHFPRMSFVSRARKVKKKGTVQQLKLVQTVSRRGLDTLTTEAVETPRRRTEKASSSSQSLSPRKRQKLNGFAAESLPSNSEGPVEFEERERETLVFVPL